MIKKIVAILVVAQMSFGATENIRVDTKTHKVQRSQTSSTALFDFDFSDVTTNLSGGGGGSVPGGVNTQLQFNNSGVFGGIPYGTYNGTAIQFQTGARLNLVDPTDTAKSVTLNLSGLTTGVPRSLSLANGNSTTVIGGAAVSNQFLTTIGTDGTLTRAQPLFSNIGGTAGITQISMNTGKLLGRNTASAGVVEEITLGANLSFTGTTLNATGGGTPGGLDAELQFNDSGVFEGTPSLTTDGSDNIFATATRFFFFDPVDNTKQAHIDTSALTSGASVTVKVAGNSTTVIGDSGAANNFLTAISPTTGAITKAQPAFTNLSGSIAFTQQNIPVGANVYVDDVNGIDVSGVRGRLDKPFKTITAAFVATSSGDTIYIGPGTYSQGGTALVVPANVSVFGSGIDITKITGTVGTTRAVVEPGNNSLISDVTITNTSTGIGYGVGSGSTAFTSATLSSSKVVANNNTVYVNKTGASGLLITDSTITSLGDAFVVAFSGSHAIRNTDISSDGTTTAMSRAIQASDSTIRVYNSTLTAGNSTTTNIAVDTTSNGIVELHDVTINRNATGTTNLDLRQAGSAVVAIDNITRTDYAALTTSGTITEISRYARTGLVASSGLTMATDRILGRDTAATGAIEELTIGAGLSVTGGALVNTVSGLSDGDKGDVTVSASGATWTIDNSAVTLAKIANAAASSRLLGSNSSGSGSAYTEITLGAGLTITGGALTLPTLLDDTAFASSWNGVTSKAPTQNAVYDWGHTFDTDDDGKVNVLDLAAGIPKTDASGVLSLATADTDYTANAFKTIAVTGQTDVVADTASDTLTFAEGSNMTITTSGDTVTFASSGGGGSGSLVIQDVGNADATINDTTQVVRLTTTLTASRVLTLPEATNYATYPGLMIIDPRGAVNGAFTISVARAGSDTINGSTSNVEVLNGDETGGSVTLIADGSSKWETISRGGGSRFTGIFNGIGGATGRIIRFDGAKWATSAFNLAAPSTSGNHLVSDGTHWVSTALGTGVQTFLLTPSSANLASAVTGETGSGALVFGTSPDFTTGATIGGVAIPTISSTSTLTNKRITARSSQVSNVTSASINTDNFDYYEDIGLTGAVTVDTTGTPTAGQTLWVSLTGTAARGITWDSGDFEASTVALPTTTVTTARLDCGFIWNPATSKWRIVASQ